MLAGNRDWGSVRDERDQCDERDDRWDERGECSEHRWDERGDAASEVPQGPQGKRPATGGDGGVTLVPQSAGQWAIALLALVVLVAVLGGVCWNFAFRHVAADEAARGAMGRTAAASQPAASQSAASSQSLGEGIGQSTGAGGRHSLDGVLLGEMPMSGRYPIGSDGKLLRPKDAALPEAPHKPDNMRFNTQEGAEAFARYVVDSIEYMWATGDTAKVEELSSPECLWCKDIVDLTKDQTATGGWVADAVLTVAEIKTPIQTPQIEDAWRISLRLELSPHVSYNGDVVREKPAKHLSLVFIGKCQDDDWSLIGGGAE